MAKGGAVGRVAEFLRHRKDYLEDALDFLERSKLIDDAGREEIVRLYEKGDAATRKGVSTLVERLANLDIPGLGEIDLTQFDLKKLDLPSLVSKVRNLNLAQVVAESAAGAEIVNRAVERLPEAVWRFQLRLVAGGLVLVALAAAGLAFPDHGPLILYYGLLALLVVAGLWLVWSAVRLHRALKRWDIDLVVLRRLSPDERKALLLQRLVKRFASPERVEKAAAAAPSSPAAVGAAPAAPAPPVSGWRPRARSESAPPAPDAGGTPPPPSAAPPQDEQTEAEPWWRRARERLKEASEKATHRLKGREKGEGREERD